MKRRFFLGMPAVAAAALLAPSIIFAKSRASAATIKEGITKIGEQYLFEINDATTRAAIKADIERFIGLLNIEDYAVMCDESNNNQARIDNNELWIDTAVKLKPGDSFIYMPTRIWSEMS